MLLYFPYSSKCKNHKLQNHVIYWNLLSPNPSETQLEEWLKESKLHFKDVPGDLQFRVTASLALLRKNLFAEALITLEDSPGSPHRTNWKQVRTIWAYIYSIALASNQRTEEYLSLQSTLDGRPTSKAEREALALIFPNLFPQP